MRGLVLISLFFVTACATKPARPPEAAVIAPFDASKVVSIIEFGSCADQKKPEPIWLSMLTHHPDLYLGMGDNIYASRPEEKPLAKTYALQAAVPEFKSFRSTVPILATWDDHDFGENDGGGDYPDKFINKLEFLKFFPFDAKLIPADREGVYHSVIIGPPEKSVQVIFLDTRSFRSPLEKQDHPKHPLDIYKPTKDTHKTFLGEAQWTWLEQQLQQPAKFRILVSSVQLIHNHHSFERWGNFPHERERIFKLLKGTKNLLVISGDRHQGEIHHMKLSPTQELFDITSSGINKTSTITSEPAPTRIGEIFSHENYGLMEIDWAHHRVEISIRDLTGQSVRQIGFTLE